MRIWDIEVYKLCRQHLLGEHHELHVLWSVLQSNTKSGWRNHPETRRWVGKLKALSSRHSQQVVEMDKRGYRHKSPIAGEPIGEEVQTEQWQTTKEQILLLKDRCKRCKV